MHQIKCESEVDHDAVDANGMRRQLTHRDGGVFKRRWKGYDTAPHGSTD